MGKAILLMSRPSYSDAAIKVAPAHSRHATLPSYPPRQLLSCIRPHLSDVSVGSNPSMQLTPFRPSQPCTHAAGIAYILNQQLLSPRKFLFLFYTATSSYRLPSVQPVYCSPIMMQYLSSATLTSSPVSCSLCLEVYQQPFLSASLPCSTSFRQHVAYSHITKNFILSMFAPCSPNLSSTIPLHPPFPTLGSFFLVSLSAFPGVAKTLKYQTWCYYMIITHVQLK